MGLHTFMTFVSIFHRVSCGSHCLGTDHFFQINSSKVLVLLIDIKIEEELRLKSESQK